MLEQIQEIMQAFLGDSIEPIDCDARLYTDLGLKSLDLINIVGMIEDKFDIEIPDDLSGYCFRLNKLPSDEQNHYTMQNLPCQSSLEKMRETGKMGIKKMWKYVKIAK